MIKAKKFLGDQERYIDQLINSKGQLSEKRSGLGRTTGEWVYNKTCKGCVVIAWAITIFKERKIYLGEEGEELFLCPDCGIVFRVCTSRS